MTAQSFWVYMVAITLTSSAVGLQIYLLVFKHLHLSPKAMASRWCIAAGSAGFLFKLVSVTVTPDPLIPNYLLIPIILFSVGATGLCVETLYDLTHHNRRSSDSHS